jgi:hypothetical protein
MPVAHPAAHAERLRFIVHGVAVSHALHGSSDNQAASKHCKDPSGMRRECARRRMLSCEYKK